MASNEVGINQNKTELKHLYFLKDITLKFLIVLSSVYVFVKDNLGVAKTMIVSAENAVVSVMGPVYEKLKDLPELILVFVDEKFEEYAPALAKKLVAKLEPLIEKTIPLVQKVLTEVVTTTTVSLQIILSTIKPLVQTILTNIKSTPLGSQVQMLLRNSIDSTTSLVQDSIIRKGPELANQALDKTKSIVAGIPLVGNVAQSLITNPTDLANQALDTTKSVMGGIPLVGNVARSLITSPTDIANQLFSTTNSLVKENPVLGAVSSVAQNIVKEAQSAGMKAALQSAYMSFKLVGIPVIAQFWYKANKYPLFNKLAEFVLPVTEYMSEWYNKLVKYMDGKGYSLFGHLPSVPIDELKAAYKLVKTAMDGLSAVGDPVGMDNDN